MVKFHNLRSAFRSGKLDRSVASAAKRCFTSTHAQSGLLKPSDRVHWLPSAAGEIACGHEVEHGKQWSKDVGEVSCFDCLKVRFPSLEAV